MTNKDIKNRIYNEETPCYIIAEMSANHGGDIEKALEIVRAAKDAGADCIKIQTYTADTLTIDCDNKYFKINKGNWEGETLYSLYNKAYTPWQWQNRIKEEADRLGLDFLSTPFDKSAVDFLEEMEVGFYKIASFEIVDIPLIKYVASKGKPIILSTGMATLGEIEDAVKAIRSQGNNDICLLKCSSAYPAIPEDMNLKSIETIKNVFGVTVGLSDHSLGSIAAVTAVALGAKVIEKHFCISRRYETADSAFSMEFDEFKKMVEEIRLVEKAIGKVSFDISENEENSKVFRKSIFVVKDIEEDETLTEENIRVIRPGNGLMPKYYEDILGKRASKVIKKGTPLSWSLIKD